MITCLIIKSKVHQILPQQEEITEIFMSINVDKISYCKIHPAIGVARVGNSPNEFFIAPEVPNQPADPEGGFKDSEGRIKRQSARFRIYAYDDQGNVIGEITDNDAAIEWKVELANKKGAWHRFRGRWQRDKDGNVVLDHNGKPVPIVQDEILLRNPDVQGNLKPDQRDQLIIAPGSRQVQGANHPSVYFDNGYFLGTKVPLGEIRTDEVGRLLVLGGYGHSASVANPAIPITNYANNNTWFDDTSDGPVTAKVILKGSNREILTSGARVLVAPPNFAPNIDNLVTLYDVALEVAIEQKWRSAPERLSFTRDIYPILARGANYQWVNVASLRGHGPGKPGDFSNPELLKQLADNSDNAEAKNLRKHVFERFRNPNTFDPEQANYFYMPQLSGDGGDAVQGDPTKWFSILPGQYETLRKWAEGDFENDWYPDQASGSFLSEQKYLTLAEIDIQDQPAALDRAALEPCVGGPFFPGIEMTYIATEASIYSEALRLKPDIPPGDITKYMAVPWQADFYECNTHWWPAQRPDDVVTEAAYKKVLKDALKYEKEDSLASKLQEREPWARGVGGQIIYKPNYPLKDGETEEENLERELKQWEILRNYAGDNDLVSKWSELGFVVPKKDILGETVYVETERDPYVGMNQREYFYIMMNIDAHPDFLPKAHFLVKEFLNQAWKMQDNPDLGFPEMYRYFEYSDEAFEAKLNEIYNFWLSQALNFNLSQAVKAISREARIERLRQMAPFNQLDGAWIRNATQVGPIDEVHALLFSIWMDEVGCGTVEQNHSNLYTTLLNSVGIYLPDINTRDYAYNPDLLESAYTSPLFELVISQFSEEFLPEILGMTLNLEWEVLSIKQIIEIFSHPDINIDPHFYKLHLAIDNASSGHGAMAKQAIQIFLDKVRNEGGEAAVQEAWKRIWGGYIAFAFTGTLGDDLLRIANEQKPDPNDPSKQLRQKMVEMMERKKEYASLNHGSKKVGGNLINDWFQDPEKFLDALVEHGYIDIQQPEKSRLFTYLSFTGPMYKVFTEEEISLWHEWARSLGKVKPELEHLPHRNPMLPLLSVIPSNKYPQGKVWGKGAIH